MPINQPNAQNTMHSHTPRTQSAGKRHLFLPVILLLLCILIISAGLVLYTQQQQKLAPKRYDLERISQASYNGVFFSMYPLTGYNEEDFATFRGVDTILSSYSIPKWEVLSEYIDAVFVTDNNVTNIYLGLEPSVLWETCDANDEEWNRQLESYFIPYLTEYPMITFEILLPYPDMSYWTSMTVDEMHATLDIYGNLVEALDSYSNVTIYFVGGEHWLIANPGNYNDALDVNPVIAQKLMLLTFCDHQFQITPTNADTLFDNLSALVTYECTVPSVYPDLSEWQLVFFGDSIIGNYKGSFSVPGVVTGLSGASTYNYAIGGTQAADMPDYDNSFPDMVQQFIARELSSTRDDTEFPYETLETSEQKLCFVIHYGLNDYFNGGLIHNPDNPNDAETFSGALRTGVAYLQETYPDATILLMTPPFCTYFSNGMDKNSDMGGILTDYVAAVEQVALEQNVICMNNYTGLGITEATSHIYLTDGCHLNETGRFLLGTQIIAALE